MGFQRVRGWCKRIGTERKYHLPTAGDSRPLQRGIKGPVFYDRKRSVIIAVFQKSSMETGNKGGTAGEMIFHARPFIYHEWDGRFCVHPETEKREEMYQ